ncbi:MAG: hypothetical protein NPIRA05_08530 [Nitrospirales bacterium]|nr:MAG: hypothetical protein NPIRA05_08530 [Nitrospirales bacterium]
MNLFRINVLLYSAIVLVAIVCWPELRWAIDALPGYLDGSISSPVERVKYRDAKHMIRTDQPMDDAERLLNESITIDPNSEAVYWLGEYYVKTQQPERALQQFTRFLEFDQTDADVYVKVAALLNAMMQRDEARRILQQGVDYFEGRLDKYIPRYAPEIRAKYNQKAWRTYRRYRGGLRTLKQELSRIDLSGQLPSSHLEQSPALRQTIR